MTRIGGSGLELVTHSNEIMSTVRRKIANKLDCSKDRFQIFVKGSIIPVEKDHKCLSQLGFDKKQPLTIKYL